MNSLNLSRVVNNPALQQNFVVQRNLYELMNEGENTLVATEMFPAVAVITPTTEKDKVAFLSEGQRELHAITIYSPVPLLMSNADGQESDVILWSGQSFRVAFSKPWQLIAGYWYVIATGFASANGAQPNGS
jgi:hypothetical protein